MESSNLVIHLVAWLGGVAAILFVRWRRRIEGSGLLFAYLVNLWTIHWLGACLYMLPWFPGTDFVSVEAGFEQSLYGLWAFVIGSLVLAPALMSLRPGALEASPAPQHPKLATVYLLVGGGSYVLASTFVGRLPTISAVFVAGQQLLVVGLCLSCWRRWQEGNAKRLVALLALTLLLPLMTIISSGFLGYGAVAALTVFVFVSSFVRPRWIVPVGFVVLAYLGFSFYVSYMRDRGEIREVVWGGKPIEERVEQVLETIGTLEWFDPLEPSHLWAIDRRLNQNVFVGVAANRFALGGLEASYAHGETFIDAVFSLIPRALWADKPIKAGSGDLVTRYTGIRFAEGTSVGIGQLMEFYINFGTVGVVIGFMLIGIVVSVIDAKGRERLNTGDWRGFALWYLPGISLLQVGGSLVEIVGTAGASMIAVLLVNRFVTLRSREARAAVMADRTQPLAR